MTETNMNWNKLPFDLHPRQTTKSWWECVQWTTTCNRHDSTQQEYQLGGAAILVINKMAHRATKPGKDKAGLGRWCWARLREKSKGHDIRVYSGYRLGKTHGPHMTYQQHQRYLAKYKKHTNAQEMCSGMTLWRKSQKPKLRETKWWYWWT